MRPPASSRNPTTPINHGPINSGPSPAGSAVLGHPSLATIPAPNPYYHRDAITLYHADARELVRRLAPGSVDVIIADPPPPPGLTAAGNPGWDELVEAADWHAQWLGACQPLTRPQGAVWVFATWRTFPVLARASLAAGWPIASVLVWDKQYPRLGHRRGLRPCYDLILHLTSRDWQPSDRSIRDVWQHPWAARRHATRHPHEKPVGLLRRLLETSHHPPRLLLDPFSGAGSALVAAKQLGIAAVGIEVDPRWCHVAAARLEATAQPSTLRADAS